MFLGCHDLNFDYRGLEQHARRIRKIILEMVYRSKASHVVSALSIVDILTIIYFSNDRTFKSDKPISQRDSLILSKGHACSALYATLSQFGVTDILWIKLRKLLLSMRTELF